MITNKERMLQIAACFMIELILFMPVYISDVFALDEPDPYDPMLDTTPPFINVTIPLNYNKLKMHITGHTEPYSNLKLYVNSVYQRQISQEGTGASGSFAFNNVALVNMQTNTIRIEAEDRSGNLNEITETVFVDAIGPNVTISPIPSFSADSYFRINGTVNEPVHMEFYVKSGEAEAAKQPSAVQSLHVDQESLQANSITLAWRDNPEGEEVTHYLIYRSDVGLLADATGTPFDDILVSTNTTYTYEVSAVSKYCTEGPRSKVTITTPLGGIERNKPDVYHHECEGELPQLSMDIAAGTFDETIELFAGKNYITINIIDITGNELIISNTTYVDTEPPVISGVNFDYLDPSYIRDVTLEGIVSENATVHVYLNNDTSPENSKRTSDDGSFSVDIKLQRTISLEKYERTGADVVELETGKAWLNYINITAVDDAGQSSSELGEITYAICGQGADWDIDMGDVTPDIILPRMLLEGLAQIGMDAKLKWQGPGDQDTATVNNLQLVKMPLNVDQLEKYDIDWIKSIPVPVHDDQYINAYFLINLQAPEAPGNTTLERENNLSDHRVGECAIPEMGCIKLPLMLRIDYTYYDPYNRSEVQRTQIQCIDLKIMIDRRAPTDKIPTEFLLTSIDALNSTINLIDKILKPVTTARKWVFLACAGTWIMWWLKRVDEWKSCIGAKPETCDPEKDEGDNQNCRPCLQAKSSTIAFWIKSQMLCDRILCPAAPTIQNYVNQNSGKTSDDKLVRSHCAEQEIADINYIAIKGEGKQAFDDFMNPENMTLYVRPSAPGLAGYPNQDYCEFEYHMNYDSVALFMDELEESYCLTYPDKASMEATGIDCGGYKKVLRLIGGICTSDSSGNKTISSRIGAQTVYYEIQELEPNNRIARRVLKERETRRETVDGKVTVKDVEVYTPKFTVLQSKDCKDEKGKPITFTEYGKQGKPLTDKQIKAGQEDTVITEDVWLAVCQPAKDYAIDPTSGLVVAFRSVCLTAIASYLQHWRTILMMVKNCLNTIVVTGDGSAGICKQVLTIYLCDLIYFAIKCVKEHASKGYGADRAVGGDIGGFLSYMQGSSANMQQGIRGRYGSTAVYQTLFVERKLIHSVCAFAFTGDWNLDLDAFLEEEVTVPIKTSCFATGTRRFLTKDPSQGGQAKFMYHIGAFIVSGAKDLRYNIELICSSDSTCTTDIDPSGGGVCDCLRRGKGTETTHIGIGPGHLGQGEVVDDEAFMQLIDPYRYDRVRILISYTDANNRKIENEVCGNTRIMEVGHAPPSDCSFDLADLSYHCEFEWGAHGTAEFKGSVGFKDDDNIFFDGQKLYIDGEIEKLEKSSQMNEKMALGYKIYRENDPLTLYKNVYVPFSQSNRDIMDLLDPPLEISSTAPNEVTKKEAYKFNPFANLKQETTTQIKGVEDPLVQPSIPGFLLDDVLGGPIQITITKEGESVITTPECKCPDNFIRGTMDCEVSGREKTYKITVNLKKGKLASDINKDIHLKIFPPQTQTVSIPSELAPNMVLELSLHYIDPATDDINPTPMTVDGVRQVKKLKFEARNEQKPVAEISDRCDYTGSNPNLEGCFCDPAKPTGKFDCGTDDDHRYCYNIASGWVCTKNPKPQESFKDVQFNFVEGTKEPDSDEKQGLVFFHDVWEIAKKENVNYHLVLAVIATESDFVNINDQGDTLAHGVMQMLKGAVSDIYDELKSNYPKLESLDSDHTQEHILTSTEREDVKIQIHAGTLYLKKTKTFLAADNKPTDTMTISQAYHDGPAYITKEGDTRICDAKGLESQECKESNAYIPKVSGHYNSYAVV
ncbi:MAG: transglycosylase SLT domain-containing protein [Nanoarchaeota archaeon]|nr:transglycosylase SLT domain-containing protein [Nanoarchaeota archaeon]